MQSLLLLVPYMDVLFLQYSSIKFDQMAQLLDKFKEIKGAKWKEGAGITYDDFSEYLLLPKSEALREVFDLYDRVCYNLKWSCYKKKLVIVAWNF